MDAVDRDALFELLWDCHEDGVAVRIGRHGCGEGSPTRIHEVSEVGVYVDGGFVLLSAIASVGWKETGR